MSDTSVEDLAQTKAGQELIKQALRAAEGRREQTTASSQAQGEYNKLLEEARETGDFSAFGEWAAEKMLAAQQRTAVDGQVQEGVNSELMGFVQARYGKQVEAMSPADVAKLDAMPLADALEQLEAGRAKAPGTGQGEGLVMEDRARAIAERKMELGQQEGADWEAMRASIDEQCGGEEASMVPVEESVEGGSEA